MKAAVYQGKEQLIVQEVPEPSEVEVTLEMESAVDDRITDVEETKNLLGSVEEQFPDHIHLWAPGVGTKHGFGDDMDFDPANVEYQRKFDQGNNRQGNRDCFTWQYRNVRGRPDQSSAKN